MDEALKPSLFARIFGFLRRYIVWVLLVIFVLWTYGAYMFGAGSVYRAYPGLSSAAQENKILTEVGALIDLPSGTPTIATISDAASAKQSQPFLTNAQDGDILIVYPQAAEAILYRPSTNKLIAVGPVMNNQSPSAQQQPITVSPVTSTTTHATTSAAKK